MGSHPRPTNADVKAAYKRGLTYGLRLTSNKVRATELVQSAMFAALDGPTRWDPAVHPDFDSHVCNLMWSHYGNASQSYEAEHSDGSVTATHENRREGALPDAEETLRDDKVEALAQARNDALAARIQDDPLVQLLLDAAFAGEDATDRAKAAGHSGRDIEFARRRLARHIEAVMRVHPTPTDDREEG